MNTYYSKLSKFVYIICIVCFFTSCGSGEEKGCENPVYPEPSENPAYLTAEAQTRSVHVKYMMRIGTNISDDQDPFPLSDGVIIKNDWITMTWGHGLPNEIVEITVKENTSNQPRSYELLTCNKWLETPLIITQNGKAN